MLITCNNCNSKFQAFPSEIKAGNAKYCSRKCFEEGRITSQKKICLTCHKEFKVYLSEIRKGGGKYCSHQCFDTRNGEKQKIQCQVCQKVFIVTPHILKQGSGKYCSLPCLRVAQSSHPAHNANPIFIKCQTCQKEFKTVLSRVKDSNKFCSKKCYLVDHSKNIWSTGICKGCGKEFKYITHRNQTTCSLSCNSTYRWKTHRESNNIEENKVYHLGELRTLTQKVRRLAQCIKWRDLVLYRDNFQCSICKSTEFLEVDHIISLAYLLRKNNITSIAQARECIELWDISNGQVLCRTCHMLTTTYGYKSAIG